MHSMDNLQKLNEIGTLKPDAMKAFQAYSDAALGDGAIPKKYKELMAIAVGLTTQCAYCIEFHRKAAVEAGATAEELAETIHIAGALRMGGAVTHGTHLFVDS